MAIEKSYGTWRSPIGSDLVARGAVRVGDVVLDSDGVFVSESRPMDGGRSVIVRLDSSGRPHDVLPAAFSARSRVHEYGGGAFTVFDGTLAFVNVADQQLYRCRLGHHPVAITKEGSRRHASPRIDAHRRRVLCVVEEHKNDGSEPSNRLESVDLEGAGESWTLASGADFYSSLRLSPDGTLIAWLSWNHPNMPWDGTELWVAHLDAEGRTRDARRVAGGVDESIFQPEWGADGSLFFVSDRSGWWNLYRMRGDEVEPLKPIAAEFGLPGWLFEMKTYAVLDDGRLACTYARDGEWELALLDPETGALEKRDTPFSEFSSISASGSRVVFVAASPSLPTRLVAWDLESGSMSELREFGAVPVPSAYLSSPQRIEFPTTGGGSARALFYPPTNAEYDGPDGERPPLVVKSHGGPTGAASTALSLRTQYLTSRGVAVVDVDYRGSTGYGRAFRCALDGMWGIADVEDCISAARYLADAGLADPDRLFITGGSAGGYTTLVALTFHDVFTAGASHYGVSDLESLVLDSHKFESRYLDRLVGPYPSRRDLYAERSPIRHAERLSRPVIFFQGLDDKVVPPNQAERMFEILKEKGIEVAYVAFPGEQHGFRRAENIRKTVADELAFFGKIGGFDVAGEPSSA